MGSVLFQFGDRLVEVLVLHHVEDGREGFFLDDRVVVLCLHDRGLDVEARAIDAPAADEDLAVGVAVVGAVGAVHEVAAAELGDHADHHVLPHAHRAHVVGERAERAVELRPNEGSEVILELKEALDRLYETSAGLAAKGQQISTENRVLFHRVANTLNYMDIRTVVVSCGTCMDQLLKYEFEKIFPGCRLLDIHEYLMEKGVRLDGVDGVPRRPRGHRGELEHTHKEHDEGDEPERAAEDGADAEDVGEPAEPPGEEDDEESTENAA